MVRSTTHTPEVRASIDALTSIRFLAALYVLFFHAGAGYLKDRFPSADLINNFLYNGHLGVPFFFVLSGFILAYTYEGKLGTALQWWRFALARFARVYPVYLLALLLLLPTILHEASWHSLPQFLMLQYWLPRPSLNIFDNQNTPAWSLSVELAFYILFPPLMLLLARLGRRGILLIGLASAAAILAFRLPSLTPRIGPSFVGLDYVPFMLLRVPEFLYGMCLGLVFRNNPARFSADWFLGLVSLLTVAILASSISVWVSGIATILFGALIIAVASNRSPIVTYVLGHRYFVLAGAASYALYILQAPVRYWLETIWAGEHEFLVRVLYQPLLILISIVVFKMFEEPVREWIRHRGGMSQSQGAHAVEMLTRQRS